MDRLEKAIVLEQALEMLNFKLVKAEDYEISGMYRTGDVLGKEFGTHVIDLDQPVYICFWKVMENCMQYVRREAIEITEREILELIKNHVKS